MRQLPFMLLVIFIGCILLLLKLFAWYKTGSNAILADALESIVNLLAGSFAAYSIYYASQPKDKEHPYGHGKMEFFAAGVEGSLILIAGFSIVVRGIWGLFHTDNLSNLEEGSWLTAISLVVNGVLGFILIRKGKKADSIAMEADGKHLIADALTSIGLLAGLLIMSFSKAFWLDNLLAILFGALILRSGLNLIRRSVSGLLDQADFSKLEELITEVDSLRKINWVDIHNVRMQKFGSRIHIDLHLTLPWYFTLEEAHNEVKEFEKVLEKKYPGKIELFIHSDPCLPESSCEICLKQDCLKRMNPFTKRIAWNLENALLNSKHGI